MKSKILLVTLFIVFFTSCSAIPVSANVAGIATRHSTSKSSDKGKKTQCTAQNADGDNTTVADSVTQVNQTDNTLNTTIEARSKKTKNNTHTKKKSKSKNKNENNSSCQSTSNNTQDASQSNTTDSQVLNEATNSTILAGGQNLTNSQVLDATNNGTVLATDQNVTDTQNQQSNSTSMSQSKQNSGKNPKGKAKDASSTENKNVGTEGSPVIIDVTDFRAGKPRRDIKTARSTSWSRRSVKLDSHPEIGVVLR